jgi:hypothetical protein
VIIDIGVRQMKIQTVPIEQGEEPVAEDRLETRDARLADGVGAGPPRPGAPHGVTELYFNGRTGREVAELFALPEGHRAQPRLLRAADAADPSRGGGVGPVSDSTCDTWREALAMQLFGDLSPNERAGLAAHLDGCADCRDVAREIADTFEMLGYVDPTNVTPTASVPPELTDRVLA